jgi:hypothetical protein
MCPQQGDGEWASLKSESPRDFELAVVLEREIRERDPDITLHKAGIPLDQIPFNENQSDLFDGCDSGYCWT